MFDTFTCLIENSGFEPKGTDTASCTKVRSSKYGQKRDKFKGGFANGLRDQPLEPSQPLIVLVAIDEG